MRNRLFVAEHRGGLLSPDDHRSLMKWALLCTEHLGEYLTVPQQEVIISALEIGHRWSEGDARTGEAMKASRAVPAFARTVEDKPSQFYCRSVGQAVATAHMADHSLGPVWYGRKMLVLLNRDAEKELYWQLERLADLNPELLPRVQEELQKILPMPSIS
ncbi:MAG: putative immunity protein [Sphaerochaeta sp.]